MVLSWDRHMETKQSKAGNSVIYVQVGAKDDGFLKMVELKSEKEA